MPLLTRYHLLHAPRDEMILLERQGENHVLVGNLSTPERRLPLIAPPSLEVYQAVHTPKGLGFFVIRKDIASQRDPAYFTGIGIRAGAGTLEGNLQSQIALRDKPWLDPEDSYRVFERLLKSEGDIQRNHLYQHCQFNLGGHPLWEGVDGEALLPQKTPGMGAYQAPELNGLQD